MSAPESGQLTLQAVCTGVLSVLAVPTVLTVLIHLYYIIKKRDAQYVSSLIVPVAYDQAGQKYRRCDTDHTDPQ